MIQDWEHNQCICLHAKILATVMVILTVSYPLIFRDFAISLKLFVVLCITCSLTFIWTRPSTRDSEPPALGR
jgi:uncharacterized membrane protein YbaN (DUF454 family)